MFVKDHRFRSVFHARYVLGLLVCALVAAHQPPRAVAAQPQTGPQAVYFSASGHHLDNRYGFLDFWRANGQLLRFGYPITDVIQEAGRPVQYFERARMEYHAAHAGTAHSVLLGLLGRELSGDRKFPIGPVAAGRHFPETGYTVIGKFRQYWERWGGLSVFGYPISESYVETLPDGRQLAVQWFERARLEYHPENVHPFYRQRRQANNVNVLAPYEIQMGQVGHEVAQALGHDLSSSRRSTEAPEWAPALWPQRIEIDLSEQRLTGHEGDLQVFSTGVSTGKAGFETVTGTFNLYAKLLYDDMTGAQEGEEWDVRKVPHVMYFHRGFALHGTYWHEQFGTGARVSHGCVNLPLDAAEWLWNWAQPAWDPERASRPSSHEPLEPKSEAEADLQPLEGHAIFKQGTPVIVHPPVPPITK